jgi:hypothetical protein
MAVWSGRKRSGSAPAAALLWLVGGSQVPMLRAMTLTVAAMWVAGQGTSAAVRRTWCRCRLV